MFCAGKYLYALNPTMVSRLPLSVRTDTHCCPARCRRFRASDCRSATFKDIIVRAGFEKRRLGFDVQTGKLLWTFHTVRIRANLVMKTGIARKIMRRTAGWEWHG